MFTAVSILQLVEQGTISLDDPLAKYLPGVIAGPADTAIRVKHLLTHSSGLGDFLFVPQLLSANRAKYRTIADFLPLLKDDKPSFTPGTKWRYSNTGFLLLGAILEKVEGAPYDSVIARRVFRRAGMTETEYLDLDLVPKRIAYTYTREMTDSGQEPELSSPEYGFGAQMFGATGNLVGHTGSGPGTAAIVQFDKTTGLTAIVLSNNAGPSGAIVRRLFATFPVPR